MWIPLVALATPVAEAAWPRHPDLIVPDPADDTLLEGPREPAVAYSPGLDTWVAVWSYLDPNLTDLDCPDGVWSLAYATSPDGLAWTPQGQVLQPTPGSGDYWQCMARQPTAVFDDTDTLLVWFVAHQGTFALPERTGLGLSEITLDPLTLAVTAVAVTALEALPSPNVDAPSAVWSASTGHALLAMEQAADVVFAEGTPAALAFTGPSPIPGGAAPSGMWPGDELWSPGLLCSGNLIFPYTLLLGGRTGSTWGIGTAVGSLSLTWVLGVSHDFTDPRDLRGFDVLRLGASDLLVFLEVPGPAGTDSTLMAASSVATWANADVAGERCP